MAASDRVNNRNLTIPYFLTIHIQRGDGPQGFIMQCNCHTLSSNIEISFSDLSNEFKHQILKTKLFLNILNITSNVKASLPFGRQKDN